MNSHPTREDARRRLQEAQRAEAVALADSTKAYAARARVQTRVDAADQNIAEAVAKLAEVSGLDRAAQLLDQPLGVVKRAVQAAEHSRSGADTARPISP
ncbi:hypothetical protein [Knoellia aerolata]|uniref:Uncharacterized protein n=1 Tax=Knoellia aerolata DSM 18566 TaxID=1385519 RepID=A0A0A0JVX1_9MICO|nr:hypothetical protein [Knoellia aerolata]KGN40834.1 hypothetical protein N801_10985 [Knoellia aerolata DSM 18566]